MDGTFNLENGIGKGEFLIMKNWYNTIKTWWIVKKQIKAAKKVIIPFIGKLIVDYSSYVDLFNLIVSHKDELINLASKLTLSTELTPEKIQEQVVSSIVELIHTNNLGTREDEPVEKES